MEDMIKTVNDLINGYYQRYGNAAQAYALNVLYHLVSGEDLTRPAQDKVSDSFCAQIMTHVAGLVAQYLV